MLTYYQVHAYYTLPALAALILITRPFLNKYDTYKLAFLSVLAFVYTSPWDNYIVSNGAWGYCDGCILGRVGWVPYEEYAFFVIQTWLSGLFACLVFHFGYIPTNNLAPIRYQSSIRIIPLLLFAVSGAWGWNAGQPNTPTFYIGSIFWWIAPVISLQWAVAGPFIWQQRNQAIFCIALSTLFLCWIDTIALREGAWEIMGGATTGFMLTEDLPLEEGVFFLMTNVILVCGLLAADRTLAILKMTNTLYFHPSMSFFEKFKRLLVATLTDESQLDPIHISDIKIATDLIRVGSKSFTLAAKLYPWDLRHDIHAMYGFCRITDDITDNKHLTNGQKKVLLAHIRRFIDDFYIGKAIPWQKYTTDFTSIQIAAMRNFFRVADIVPKHSVIDLINGYLWDLEKNSINDINDLIKYSKYVASTVGEMCTCMMFNSIHGPHWREVVHNPNNIIRHAIDMGIALQIINIARDIITDAKMSRLYIPPEFIPKKTNFSKSAFLHRLETDQVTNMDNTVLKSIAYDLISLANTYAESAKKGIKMLPKLYRAPVRTALKVYTAIGDEIRKKEKYPERGYVERRRQIEIFLKALYIDEFVE